MVAFFAGYFMAGAIVADHFDHRYRKRWGRSAPASKWLDVMTAWPAYLIVWRRAGR